VKGSDMLYAYRARGSTGSNIVEARGFSCFCDKCLNFEVGCTRPGGSWEKTCAAIVRDSVVVLEEEEEEEGEEEETLDDSDE